MPSPERNQYSNKESAKVNNGLDFGIPESTDTSPAPSSDTSPISQQNSSNSPPDPSSAFASNLPSVDIEFSLLSTPPVAPEPKPSLGRLIHRLLHPPQHAFPHGTFSIQWVIGAVVYRHFEFRDSDERWVLKRDSGLRERGREMGTPVVLWEWLTGNGEGSASDLGVMLTPESFKELR
jgi:hypothetical protein